VIIETDAIPSWPVNVILLLGLAGVVTLVIVSVL
jgi:hypothetical protein